jgi:hypothetical protein
VVVSLTFEEKLGTFADTAKNSTTGIYPNIIVTKSKSTPGKVMLEGTV